MHLGNLIHIFDYSVETPRKRHLTGGILLSISLLFGGVALTVYLSTPKSARKSKTESRHRDELINGRKGYNYRTQRKPPT